MTSSLSFQSLPSSDFADRQLHGRSSHPALLQDALPWEPRVLLGGGSCRCFPWMYRKKTNEMGSSAKASTLFFLLSRAKVEGLLIMSFKKLAFVLMMRKTAFLL